MSLIESHHRPRKFQKRILEIKDKKLAKAVKTEDQFPHVNRTLQ